MQGFISNGTTYRVDYSDVSKAKVFEVNINDLGLVYRKPVFRDSEEEGTARFRFTRILRGFIANDAIPPVWVDLEPPESTFHYKLTHGAHRFYCSMAAGFSHVPVVVKGFDWDSLDK